MLITVQPDPNWQLSLAQLSPSLFRILIIEDYKSEHNNKLSIYIITFMFVSCLSGF